MTFLEYFCTVLMGPPASGGEYWECPFSGRDGPKFSIRPHKKPAKLLKFKCFVCDAYGDEHDLLIKLRPALNYGGRLAFLEQHKAEFDAAVNPGPVAPPRPATTPRPKAPAPTAAPTERTLPLPGSGGSTRVYDTDARDDVFSPAANNVALEVWDLVHVALRGLGMDTQPGAAPYLWDLVCETLHIVSRYGLHPDGIGMRASFEAHVIRQDLEHMAKCTNSFCGWDCCRLKRGWRPEQILRANKAAMTREEAARKKAKQRRASHPKK
jgi:hypothetical protein